MLGLQLLRSAWFGVYLWICHIADDGVPARATHIGVLARPTDQPVVAAEADRASRFPMDVFKDAWEIGLVNTCLNR